MAAKNKQIFSVVVLILVFGSDVLPLTANAATKTARWQPRFLQRQHGHSRSAGAHLFASSSAVHDAALGRSADIGTGRDLFKKLMMFKSLYQQNNGTTTAAPTTTTTTVTSPTADTTPTTTTPTTTTSTTPTTITATTPTNTNTVTTTRMATLPPNAISALQARGQADGMGGRLNAVDSNIPSDIADGSVVLGGNSLGAAEKANTKSQQRPLKRRRLGVLKNGNFNVPPIRRKQQTGIGGGGGGVVNGFGQQSNRRKVRIITKKRMKSKKNKKNKIGSGNNKSNRNTNNRNKNHSNDNNNNNKNSNPNRFQNIMNAFRLQTPVVYNH